MFLNEVRFVFAIYSTQTDATSVACYMNQQSAVINNSLVVLRNSFIFTQL